MAEMLQNNNSSARAIRKAASEALFRCYAAPFAHYQALGSQAAQQATSCKHDLLVIQLVAELLHKINKKIKKQLTNYVGLCIITFASRNGASISYW